jgi:hypothetical protein
VNNYDVLDSTDSSPAVISEPIGINSKVVHNDDSNQHDAYLTAVTPIQMSSPKNNKKQVQVRELSTPDQNKIMITKPNVVDIPSNSLESISQPVTLTEKAINTPESLKNIVRVPTVFSSSSSHSLNTPNKNKQLVDQIPTVTLTDDSSNLVTGRTRSGKGYKPQDAVTQSLVADSKVDNIVGFDIDLINQTDVSWLGDISDSQFTSIEQHLKLDQVLNKEDLDDTVPEIYDVSRDPEFEKQYGIPPVPRSMKHLTKNLNCPYFQKWINAVKQELGSLQSMGTFEAITKLPPNTKKAKTILLFTLKATKFKCRLVVLGNLIYDRGDDNYAATCKPTTIRLLTAKAAELGADIRQLDVKNAFINAPCSESIVIAIPEGMNLVKNDKSNVVGYRLKKMLYGLRQAPRKWYEFLLVRLSDFGLCRSSHDPCLFIKPGLFLAFYVDDGIYFGTEANKFEVFMKTQFDLNDPCEIRTYTGYEFLRTPNGYFMHQTQFIEKLAQDFSVNDQKMVFTPLPQSLKLDSPQHGTLQDPEYADIPYRNLIQGMRFICGNTRPDCLYALNYLSRFCHCYTEQHYKYALYLLTYMLCTRKYALFFPFGAKDSNRALVVEDTEYIVPQTSIFCDASFAPSDQQRKSPGSFISFYRGTPVDWACKHLSGTSLSPAEAELKILSMTLQRARWFRWMLIDLSMMLPRNKVTVFSDNTSALENIQRPSGSSSKMLHIEKHYYFIQDMLSEVTLKYLPTKFMIADIGTKLLPRALVERFRSWMLINYE